MAWYDRIVEKLAPSSAFGGEGERVRRARLVLAFSLLLAVASVALAGFQLAFGSPRLASVLAIGPLVSLAVILALRLLRAERLAGNLLCLALAAVLTVVVVMRGGLGTPVVMAYAAVPMLALVLADRRSGWLWLLLTEILVVGVWLYGRFAGPLEREPISDPPELNLLGHGLYVAVLFLLAGVYEHLRRRALEDLTAAQASLLETERARLESEAEARALRSSRMAELGTLAAGVAHEINNPLTYVSANAAYLLEREDPALPEETREVLAEISAGAARIAKIVRDVGLFSRLEPEEKPVAVAVDEVIETSLRLLGNQLRHRADVERRFGRAPPVLGSPGRLEQVFVNVLLNALQAIPEERRGRIVVGIREAEGRKVLVEIEDDGRGMTPEVQIRILEPFFTTKPVGVGTGLGLSLCYGIVTGLGGSIAFDSEPGRGTRVLVELPAAEPCEPGDHSGGPSAGEARALRVLLVDDEALVARSIERVLAGWVVVMATSAERAREALANEGPFDAVLCDLMMPGENGMDFYEGIARTSPALARRFVFMTGGAFTERARQFLATVPNPILEKPTSPAALEAALRAAAGKA